MQATTPPLVIAHRGACGYRPEHTLEAYALAIEQGADFIEPDLVPTADGVLVARHDAELSASTDVASFPEFADRRCIKRVDGVDVHGWFVEDFTLAELRRLRARERLPELRPASAAFDGRFGIPTLSELIALVKDAERDGRRVGLYPELKTPRRFEIVGRRLDGAPIALSPGELLVRTLCAEDFTDPARVFVQSFEPTSLRALREHWFPALGVSFPLVQLLGTFDATGPYDLVDRAVRDADASLPRALRAPVPPCFGDLVGDESLRWLRGFVDVLAPTKSALIGFEGLPAWARAAREFGFRLHAWTMRVELGGEEEARQLFALGVDGLFFDQPDVGVAVRDAWVAGRRR